MAQKVRFCQNNVIFTEGPFVLTSFGGEYRIEVELKGHRCPVLPDADIFALIRGYGRFATAWAHSYDELEKTVDWLNSLVKSGEITLQGKVWLPK